MAARGRCDSVGVIEIAHDLGVSMATGRHLVAPEFRTAGSTAPPRTSVSEGAIGG
jgi:hypothetical protein